MYYEDMVESFRCLEKESGNRIICSPERLKVEEHVPKQFSEIELSIDEYLRIYGGVKDCLVREEDSDAYSICHSLKYACPSCGEYGFFVDVAGNIYKCAWAPKDKDSQIIANVNEFNGTFANTEVIDFYLKYTFPDKAKCNACKILPICLGKCPLNVLEAEKYTCRRYLNELDWVVLKLYNKYLQKQDS